MVLIFAEWVSECKCGKSSTFYLGFLSCLTEPIHIYDGFCHFQVHLNWIYHLNGVLNWRNFKFERNVVIKNLNPISRRFFFTDGYFILKLAHSAHITLNVQIRGCQITIFYKQSTGHLMKMHLSFTFNQVVRLWNAN